MSLVWQAHFIFPLLTKRKKLMLGFISFYFFLFIWANLTLTSWRVTSPEAYSVSEQEGTTRVGLPRPFRVTWGPGPVRPASHTPRVHGASSPLDSSLWSLLPDESVFFTCSFVQCHLLHPSSGGRSSWNHLYTSHHGTCTMSCDDLSIRAFSAVD